MELDVNKERKKKMLIRLSGARNSQASSFPAFTSNSSKNNDNFRVEIIDKN
jgi:hypothetical protein